MLAATAVALAGFSDVFRAKLVWIGQELRREKPGQVKRPQQTDFDQVPQYYRFNQHKSLQIEFNEQLSEAAYATWSEEQKMMSEKY